MSTQRKCSHISSFKFICLPHLTFIIIIIINYTKSMKYKWRESPLEIKRTYSTMGLLKYYMVVYIMYCHDTINNSVKKMRRKRKRTQNKTTKVARQQYSLQEKYQERRYPLSYLQNKPILVALPNTTEKRIKT